MKLIYCPHCFMSFEVTRKVRMDKLGNRVICDCADMTHECDPENKNMEPANPNTLSVQSLGNEADKPRAFPGRPAPTGILQQIEALKGGD